MNTVIPRAFGLVDGTISMNDAQDVRPLGDLTFLVSIPSWPANVLSLANISPTPVCSTHSKHVIDLMLRHRAVVSRVAQSSSSCIALGFFVHQEISDALVPCTICDPSAESSSPSDCKKLAALLVSHSTGRFS
jgi:hypothetical protein